MKYLGRVCKRGHDHGGGSLRYICGTCVSCAAILGRAWDKENADKRLISARISGKRYRERHPDRVLAAARNWQKKNIERARTISRKSAMAWKHNNPDIVNANSARRRANKLHACPVWADKKIIGSIYKEAKRTKYHVDHIVPLINPLVCGLHVEYNLQIMPPFDNMSKGNRYWPDMPE